MKALVAALFVVVFTSAASAQQKTPESCQKFVQSFYDWYVRQDAGIDKVLKERRGDLSPILFSKLLRDEEASAKAQEVVGLDADPFTASQDPEPHFFTKAPRLNGNRCSVPVYGVVSGNPIRLAVTAVTEWNGKRWVFADFLEWDSSLLIILDDLERDRQKWAKEETKSKRKN